MVGKVFIQANSMKVSPRSPFLEKSCFPSLVGSHSVLHVAGLLVHSWETLRRLGPLAVLNPKLNAGRRTALWLPFLLWVEYLPLTGCP